jgi:D-beta-D-heptose 7-phosphate kinase/D-beta-D-heptose 1-phosphate adenosyltransferase
MIEDKILVRAQIEQLMANLRSKDAEVTIVFTNGCFDLFHSGHATYLEAAKEEGDILIVGVNSDESVKRLKGETRPIMDLRQRMTVLAALESVNYVVAFEEDTPYELIKQIQPDVLVKGGDWEISQIVGADIVLDRGGAVLQMRFEEGISSSELIRRMGAKSGNN